MRTPFFIISIASFAVSIAAAQDKPTPPAPAKALPDFCQGFNAAVSLEQQRFGSWASQVLAGRGTDDKSGARELVNGVQAYVAISPLTGKIKVDDGREFDCTPIAPAPEAAKPADKK